MSQTGTRDVNNLEHNNIYSGTIVTIHEALKYILHNKSQISICNHNTCQYRIADIHVFQKNTQFSIWILYLEFILTAEHLQISKSQ